MTSEERQAHIREPPKLIADEKDPEKLTVLAAELGQLLSVESKPGPISDKKPQTG
jgi:hypothetical protein